MKKAFLNPRLVLQALLENEKISRLFPDVPYLKMKYWAIMGKKLNLENPKVYTEKLQWLKIHNRKEEYTTMVDKFAVREYIAEKLGEEYLIPLLGVWDSPDDIDFDTLPDRFVLKCNHNSGTGMCICKDKSKLDFDKVRKELKKGINEDYFIISREWPYKNVKRRIIAEQYMEDKDGQFVDYKFYCFGGNIHSVMACIDRASGNPRFYYFDREWNLLRINKHGLEAPEGYSVPKPECIDEMFEIAAKLSKDMPFVRIDLYQLEGKIYFGEITFFSSSGFAPTFPEETDKLFGSMIDLNLAK
ncbi:MAG: glycosyl transferase [Clostridia bacterium]|nr:glycosyl transferase [Clostridia bacterium]